MGRSQRTGSECLSINTGNIVIDLHRENTPFQGLPDAFVQLLLCFAIFARSNPTFDP